MKPFYLNKKFIIFSIIIIALFLIFVFNVKEAKAAACTGSDFDIVSDKCSHDWVWGPPECERSCADSNTLKVSIWRAQTKCGIVCWCWWPPWSCCVAGCWAVWSWCSDTQDCGTDYCETWSSNYCKNNDVYHQRICHDRGCSGSSCYDTTYTDEQRVQDCGSTTYGSWSYYCYNNDRYRKRTVYNRGCSESSCYYYTTTQTEYVQDCGSTTYGSWSYYCSNDDRYRKRTVYNRGCSGSSCYYYTTTQTEYVQDCGSTSYGDWSYYCYNNDRYRKRTVYNRGCSESSCYYYTTTQTELVQDCGSDYCDAWSDTYCKNNDVYRKRTCYDKGCSGGNCFNNPWTNEPLVQDCNDATEQCVQGSAWCEPRPYATNLSVDEGDYCDAPLRPIFSWSFTDPDPGDSQGAYQVQVDNNSNFSSPELDSGKVLSSSESYAAPTPLSYNTTYYWRLKVWDEHDADSGWISGPLFTTPLHAYPDPDFSWSPPYPTEDEIVQFCAVQEAGVCPEDESTCYTVGGPIPPPSCSGKSFLWTFPAGTEFATGSSATSENPQVKFDSTGNKSIPLKITNDVGFCIRTKTVGVMLPLPKWEEIVP